MIFLQVAVLAFASLVISSTSQGASVKLDLIGKYDIKAASTGFNDPLADLDGSGRAFPAEWLPAGGSNFDYSGVEFNLPPFHDPNAFDALSADSQTLLVPQGKYQSFHSLLTWASYTGSGAKATSVSFNFEDGTSEMAGLIVGSWWSRNPYDGPIHTPYHYANASLDANMTISRNVTMIQYGSCRISNDKTLLSITLPIASQKIRIFSVSLLPALQPLDLSKELDYIRVQNVRSTTKWIDFTPDVSHERVQELEVTISNLAPLYAGVPYWILSTISVHVSSASVETVVLGYIKRLRSNDQVVVVVGVINKPGVKIGSPVTTKVTLKDRRGKTLRFLNQDTQWAMTAGVPEWRSNDASLETHEAPTWFDQAKFGIFIHYGLYSVPAWAPTGVQYAEWYNWQVHNPPNASSPTWSHHLATYGPNVTYEDFFANWTASLWNPDEWTDLIANSGAKYFVLVTKHHDGVVLFDTNSTDRNSLKLGPKRNFVKELFASAKSRHPSLHRGTYFSLPEWFNPAYQVHGKPNFPGGLPLNAFTGECCEPYTGYIPVDDFLEEVQKPQLEALFYEHDTDILWCDVGYDSVFPKIGADWFNYAASQGRQVLVNNRCGANQSDMVTPEYATFSSPLSQKWESSAGMDPHSYGFNSDTPLDKYQNSSSLVKELIDIVSKGGIFLLDIGPKEDGTIIPQMTQPLLGVGRWLMSSGEAIYNSRPWWFQSQDSTLTDVRFTTTVDAFYIIAISRPVAGLRVTAPVPIVSGDQVTLLGGFGTALRWSIQNKTLAIEVSEEELDMVTLPAWAFKVSYHDF